MAIQLSHSSAAVAGSRSRPFPPYSATLTSARHVLRTPERGPADKCSLDLFWLKDDSLLDADNLADPDEIAEEIAEDLRSALEQIEEILGDMGDEAGSRPVRAR